MRLKDLIGKTCIDVVLSLPKFKWDLIEKGFEFKDVEISKLFFAQYEIKEPMKLKRKKDYFFNIRTENLSSEKIKNYLKRQGKRTGVLSLLSLAEINSPLQGLENKIGHIPMADIDINNSYLNQIEEQGLLKILKEKISFLDIKENWLILSSSKRNYHLIGVGELLDKENLIDFLGDCLIKFRYKTPKGKIINLTHPAHIGHSLNPLGYMKWRKGSYSQPKRFITLRITEKKGDDIPKVIDVYEGVKK
jgi:hypothetical protein